MTGLFLELVNMSLSAGILVLAVVGLRFLLKKAPKWLTCCLWILVAVRLVCPFSLETSFSLIPQQISTGDAVDVLTDVYTGGTKVIGDDSPDYQTAVDAGREPEYIGQHEGKDRYVVTTAMDGISEPATLADAFSIIWLAGVCLMAGYALISYLRLRHQVSASICLRENIYLCDYIESPFILGIVMPKIYLPSAMKQSQWHHVLAHERAHLRRKDHWWKPLSYALLCLHWFNPALWLAYILLCRDIELACDEKVIRDMEAGQKKAYSEALLQCSMPRNLIAACPLAFGEVGVKERVRTVLNYKKPAFWIILITVIAVAVTAVCFLTDPISKNTVSFRATVLEVSTGCILVTPEEGSDELRSADQIWVSLPNECPDLSVGNTVCIYYDGKIMESYPARINGAERITLTDWDLAVTMKKVDNTGITLTFSPAGNRVLTYGSQYTLEQYADEHWQAVPEVATDIPWIWTDIAYLLNQDEPTTLVINWEQPYGKLSPGVYRITKAICDTSDPSFPSRDYSVEFTIADEPEAGSSAGSCYRFRQGQRYDLLRIYSAPTIMDYDSYYVFDSGMFQIIEVASGEVLFQCDLADSQWVDFPFEDSQWDEICTFMDSYCPELRSELYGAQLRQLSDDLVLFLREETLYIAYGSMNADRQFEYFGIIFELILE